MLTALGPTNNKRITHATTRGLVYEGGTTERLVSRPPLRSAKRGSQAGTAPQRPTVPGAPSAPLCLPLRALWSAPVPTTTVVGHWHIVLIWVSPPLWMWQAPTKAKKRPASHWILLSCMCNSKAREDKTGDFAVRAAFGYRKAAGSDARQLL